MGLMKLVAILIIAYVALMLYGYDDWKAGETVISEQLDPLFKWYDKMLEYKTVYVEVKEVTEGGGDNETQGTT